MPDPQDKLPIGILRLRKEWRQEGLLPPDAGRPSDGDPAAGEFTLSEDEVLAVLGISARELHRLVSRGKLPCLVPDHLGGPPAGRRMFREEDIRRFIQNTRHGGAAAQRELRVEHTSPDPPAEEIAPEDLQELLLVEIRNLKEQQRDLTSFVYELAAQIRSNGHSRPKRRWYFLWLR